MRTVHALTAAGQTDTGRQRDVNEDRFYCDAARGLFFVIDGVGGRPLVEKQPTSRCPLFESGLNGRRSPLPSESAKQLRMQTTRFTGLHGRVRNGMAWPAC